MNCGSLNICSKLKFYINRRKFESSLCDTNFQFFKFWDRLYNTLNHIFNRYFVVEL